MVMTIVFSVAVAGLLTVMIVSDKSGHFHTTSDHCHYVVRIVPSVVGTLSTMLVSATINDLLRLTPWMQMHGKATARKSVAAGYWPGCDIFATGHTWWTGTASLVLPISVSLTSFKVGLFIVVKNGDGWDVYVTRWVGAILVASYTILIIFLLGLCIRFSIHRDTGLRWDPTRIADFIALFYHSPALDTFEKLAADHMDDASLLLNHTHF